MRQRRREATRWKKASRSWRAVVSIERFGLPGKRGDPGRAELEFQPVFLREPLDETRIDLSATPAQAVLEMADDQLAETPGKQPMQQNDRVASARDTDEIPFLFGQTGQGFHPPLWRPLLFHGAAAFKPCSPNQGRCRLTTRLRPNGSIAFSRICAIASSTESVT